ncbi:hypothetical protein [Marivita sp. GX14005]|uniref:hypothetical protein n=1 Tax=Marivita sp. GX14005 TaxID=2942276 RepID=UPI002018C494|nr:hypothetical protein [Marivita sp. GX14005]MCL3882276.1 hypothetical protein [Marivita sp. GX14005]
MRLDVGFTVAWVRHFPPVLRALAIKVGARPAGQVAMLLAVFPVVLPAQMLSFIIACRGLTRSDAQRQRWLMIATVAVVNMIVSCIAIAMLWAYISDAVFDLMEQSPFWPRLDSSPDLSPIEV